MKRLRALFILMLLSIPADALAHPGHGAPGLHEHLLLVTFILALVLGILTRTLLGFDSKGARE